jgi:hypothetical protein
MIAFLLVSLGHPLSGQRPDPSDWRSARDPVPEVSPFPKNSVIDQAMSWLDAGDRALEPRKAIENYEKALSAFRMLQLHSMEADTLKRLGFAYASVRRYEKRSNLMSRPSRLNARPATTRARQSRSTDSDFYTRL